MLDHVTGTVLEQVAIERRPRRTSTTTRLITADLGVQDVIGFLLDEAAVVNWIAKPGHEFWQHFAVIISLGVMHPMDASTEFVFVDLEAQEAPRQQQHSRAIELDGVDTMDPIQIANLLAANERLVAPPGEHAEDAFEIELDAEQMDALLEGRWVL